jgi:hypothetical protein
MGQVFLTLSGRASTGNFSEAARPYLFWHVINKPVSHRENVAD